MVTWRGKVFPARARPRLRALRATLRVRPLSRAVLDCIHCIVLLYTHVCVGVGVYMCIYIHILCYRIIHCYSI